MSQTMLPIDMQIEITGHLAVTSDRPMDDLHSLWATCLSMRHIYGHPAVGQHLALDRFRRGRMSANLVNYYALLASLTQVGNPEALFLTGIQTIFMEKHNPRSCLDDLARAADGRHNLAAIWSPYCSIGTMAMPATMTLRGGT